MIDNVRLFRRRVINRLADSLAEPDDTDNVRVRKVIVGLVALAIIPVNLSWSISFFYLGGTVALTGLVNLVVGAIYITGAVYLYRTKQFTTYLNILAGATLTMFLILQIGLGGFMNSGLIIVEAFMIPLLCSMLLSRWNTILWAGLGLAAFTTLLALDGQISADAPQLPANFGLVNGFFGYLTMTVFGIGVILYVIGELEKAQKQTDALLFNILPIQIARRLKQEAGVIAQSHDQASVLFADIVGFTPLTTLLSPEDMIDLLDDIYSHFDGLLERYGVEKIRTIGDSYMAVAGAPQPHPRHADAVARMALDMISFAHSIPPIGDVRLDFRIGINSGSLVGGVIGSKRTHYDIWGDAVNVASRMESHGLPGKIQVTEETRRLLARDFILESRGKIAVKGKGKMETWFIVGTRDSGTSRPSEKTLVDRSTLADD